MILLYAVVPADGGTVAAAGGLDVSVLAGDGVALLYREVDAVPETSREEVLRFGDVVTALADHGTLLPVRFGTVLPGMAEARELLQSRGRGWRDRLDDLAGQVELIVHVRAERAAMAAAPGAAPAEAAPGTGGDYLRAKVAEHRRRSAEVAEVAAVVTPWSRAVRPLSSGQAAGVRLACLVAAGDVDDLRAAVQDWAAGRDDGHVAVTGPFPVFSFTEDDVA